jgi:hypothetical protein
MEADAMCGTDEVMGRALRRFRAIGILTLAELMMLLECSRRTAQRHLRKWGCLTSFNCNSSYYALPCSVQFDRHGLWQCREARFSRYGNLAQTVVGLVCDSPAGLTAAELGELLGVNAHSFISRFRAHPDLYREKTGARFVYYAADRQIRDRQIGVRLGSAGRVRQLTDSEAIAVLVALVKHPGSTCEELARLAGENAPGATPAAIHAFLASRGLAEKKGLPESGPPVS